jgi:hypothetical protein
MTSNGLMPHAVCWAGSPWLIWTMVTANNACQASEGIGNVVHLHLLGTGEGVQLSVTDQGEGVMPERIPSLSEFGNSMKGERGNGMGPMDGEADRLTTRRHRQAGYKLSGGRSLHDLVAGGRANGGCGPLRIADLCSRSLPH